MIGNELLIETAKKYASSIAGKDQLISDPIIRLENGKYYIGFMYLDFVDEANDNYNFKRPREWLLVSPSTGETIAHYTYDTYDFNANIPFNSTFENEGNSALYNYTNFLVDSYNKWKEEVKIKINERNEIDKNLQVYNEKVIDVDDTVMSPREYIMSSLDCILDETRDTLIVESGDTVQNGYKKHYDNLLNRLRNECKTGSISKVDNEEYLKLLDYSWPGLSKLYRSFSNL